MTDSPIRTAAAHAGVLAGCQAGQRLLLHDLHAAVTEYDREARDDCATRAIQICLLEPLFGRGDLPIFEAATPAELAAYREACGRARDARAARRAAETRLSEVAADVALGPAHALHRTTATHHERSSNP